ncbi:MAG: amidohydrolase family protein [Sandaracinaceae bacterium]|nr:amidohydrolase family protein [Sandaracinaceae bacterium]
MGRLRGITANWLVSAAALSQPIQDGALVLDEEGCRIVAIGDSASLRNSYPNADWQTLGGVLLPGLVNANVVLEDLGLPAVSGRGHFELAMGIARAAAERGEFIDGEALAARCDLLRERGTVACGVSSTSLLDANALRDARFETKVFQVTRGMRADVVAVMRELSAELRSERGKGLDIIESVHSVYAVHPDAVRTIVAEAKLRGARTLVPLCESAVARASLLDGTGPFDSLLAQSSQSARDWKAPGSDSVTHAQSVDALGAHTLLVNLLDAQPGEIIQVATSGAPVVLLPRQNMHSDTRLPNVDAMLRNHIPLALGTGSCAITNDGDVLGEAAALYARFPQRDAGVFVSMATSGGATALGYDEHLGTLDVGKSPGILHIDFDTRIDSNPERFVLKERQRPRALLAPQKVPKAF